MIKLEDIVTNNRERNFSQSIEEYGVMVGRNDILPGHYYSFDVPIPNFNENWIPRSKDEWEENPSAYITNRNYYDMNPVGLVFFHDNWKNVALMLNLKVIDPRRRSNIIMTHLNMIEDNLDRLYVFDKDEETIPFKDRRGMNLPLFRIAPSHLETRTGMKLGYAISGYKLDKISRARLLDWDHIGELPMANIDQRGLAMSPGAYDITSLFTAFENNNIT